MRKLLALFLTTTMLLSLVACGKSKEAQKVDELILAIGEVTLDVESQIVAAKEYYDTLTPTQKAEVENVAILESAVQGLNELKINTLLENGDYEDALALLRTMEQTEDVREQVRKASFGVLAEFTFQNGSKGSEYGTPEGDSYYVKVTGSDIVLSTVPTADGFESISFGLIPSNPRGILAGENYLLTLYEDKPQFTYFYMFMLGRSIFSWEGDSKSNQYTRETPIDFEIKRIPETSVWQFSYTEEESKLIYRDECNEYLDEIAIILRKIDSGLTLSDLGFFSFK